MGMDTRIPFAIKTDSGQVVAIDDVERGLRCECHCPSCHGRLVAKKGQIKEHHFAHHDASQQECLYAFETSVRLMLMEKLDDISVLNANSTSKCDTRLCRLTVLFEYLDRLPESETFPRS